MIKDFIKGASFALLLGLVIACNKTDEPTIPTETNKSVPMLSLSLKIDDTNSRIAAYDIDRTNGMFKLNFERILELSRTSEGREKLKQLKVTDPANPKVPVHVIFKNKQLPGVTIYKMLKMNIGSAQVLQSKFERIPELIKHYTDANSKDWYMKAFLGGVRRSNKRIKGSDGVIRSYPELIFCNDYLYDTSDETDFYVTASNETFADPYSRLSFPFPMETPWQSVTFYFKEMYKDESEGKTEDDKKNEDYHLPNEKAQQLHLKPLGTIMRLQVTNESSKTVVASHLDFSPRSKFYTDQGNHSENKEVLINNISRVLNLDPDPDASVEAGATTIYNRDGRVHYHSIRSTASEYVQRPLSIAPGHSRFFLFWTIQNNSGRATDENFVTIPFLHNESGAIQDIKTMLESPSRYKPFFYLGSRQGTVIPRSKIQNGGTHLIRTKIKDTPRP